MSNAETVSKQAYSVSDLAGQLSLSRGYLWKEIRTGALKATRFGRRVVILKNDLDAYIASKRVAPLRAEKPRTAA